MGPHACHRLLEVRFQIPASPSHAGFCRSLKAEIQLEFTLKRKYKKGVKYLTDMANGYA